MSPEKLNDLWVKVTAPEKEEREFKFRNFSADLSIDFLLDYSYPFAIMPTSNPASAKFWSSVEFSSDEN